MTATSVRIPTWRIAIATLTETLFGPHHHGATATWLHDLRTTTATSWPGATDTAIIPIRRQPIAALTDRPHREIHDPHLGVLRVAGQVEPHLYNALVNTVNTGAVR